jgi:hypothetical protein
MLVMLFDLAIFATAALAYFGFAILLWKVIKYFVGKVI